MRVALTLLGSLHFLSCTVSYDPARNEQAMTAVPGDAGTDCRVHIRDRSPKPDPHVRVSSKQKPTS